MKIDFQTVDVFTTERFGGNPLAVLREGPTVVGARLAAPQRFALGEEIPLDVIAAACGLHPADIRTGSHRPQLASCGTPFVFVELRSLVALAGATPRTDVFMNR